MKASRRRFLILAVLIFLAGRAAAVETGEVRGHIRDEQGIGLAGVAVRISGPGLQGSRTAVSSGSGDFRFPLLPVGPYRLECRLEGFSSVVQENVIVLLGQVTSLTVVLGPAALQQEMVVTAQAPLIDKTSADTSFHLTSRDLEKLPAQNRTVVDAIKYVPGVTGVRVNTRRGLGTEGQPSFRGEGEEGNNWIVDGLSVSGVRLRNSGVKLNVDSLDEIQVISDSFSPEFGSAYGGIINMVTRSGGNDWDGEMALAFQDRRLQSPKKDQLSVTSDPSYFSNINGYFNLGGPIRKDRVWFFLSDNLYANSEETRDAAIDYLSVPGGKKTTRTNNLFAKLTWALTPNHNLSLTAIHDASLGQEGGTGLPDLFEEESFTDTIVRVNYRGILNPTTFVEAGLGGVWRDDLISPVDGNLGPAMYYIEDLGRNIRNSYGNVTDNQDRLDFSLKLAKHLETPAFGRHDLSLGFEAYRFSSEFLVDFTGKDEDIFPGDGFDAGTKYYFDSLREGRGTPTVLYEYGPLNFRNSARGIGFYVRDKATFGRFSVMAGLRSQTQTCLDNKRGTLWSWGLGDFLSPRLTLAVDLTGDGKNVLKLGWGRFSDLITTMPLGLLNSGAGLTFRTYRWQGPAAPSAEELHNPASWAFQNEQKAQAFDVARGLDPNFLTRVLIEFDRRLGPRWAARARFVRTWARDLLEILAVFDPETLYRFLYDNFEYKKRDYWGFELEVGGTVGDRFFLNASYARSSAKGTNPGQTETGSWAQEEGSTNFLGLFGNHIYIPPVPELQEAKAYVDWALGGLGGRGIGDEGWYGPLPYSVDHDVKIFASFRAPGGVLASAAFEWLSGYPWEKLGYVPFFGGYYSYPEGRGTRTTPSHAYLDLSLEKSFVLGDLPLFQASSLAVRLDVFNLLNSQQPISFVKENIPVFGSVWGRQQPRQARVMVKLKF